MQEVNGKLCRSLQEVSEYFGVTKAAISQSIHAKSNQDKLKDHIFLVGRQYFLDDEALSILSASRSRQPTIIQQAADKEEIEKAKREAEMYRVKLEAALQSIVELQSKLITEKDKNTSLIEEKSLYLSDKVKAEQQLKRAEQLEKENLEMQQKLDAALDSVSELQDKLDISEERINKMSEASLWKRIRNKW